VGLSSPTGRKKYSPMNVHIFDKLAIAILFCIVAAVAALAFLPRFNSIAVAAGDRNTLSELAITPVWVGKDLDSVTVATNTARTYLELQNIGATTSTAVYCQINDKAGAVYTGFVLGPTSTRIFDLDALYRGALRCRAQGASTTLFILES
jgi:hypothetical protein